MLFQIVIEATQLNIELHRTDVHLCCRLHAIDPRTMPSHLGMARFSIGSYFATKSCSTRNWCATCSGNLPSTSTAAFNDCIVSRVSACDSGPNNFASWGYCLNVSSRMVKAA